MSITEDITLDFDGKRLRGFEQVNIARSMKSAEITFGVRATNPAWTDSAFTVRFAKKIEIKATGVLMLAGQVDDYESETAGENREVRISGSSKSALAARHPPVRHKTGRIENKTLLQAAQEFDEIGVGFTSDVEDMRPIPMIQRHPTDSVFATIERYAREQGIMLMGEPNGSIRLTRGSDKRHSDLIEGQSRIKRLKVKVSQKNKASPTVVRNQRRTGTSATDVRDEQQVFDPDFGAFRPAIIFGESDQDQRSAKNRGEWQRLRGSAFGGLSVSLTVAGWRDANGEIYEPGRLAFISIPSEQVEQDMRLERVTFTQDEKGTISELVWSDPATTGKPSKGSEKRRKSNPGFHVTPPVQGFE